MSKNPTLFALVHPNAGRAVEFWEMEKDRPRSRADGRRKKVGRTNSTQGWWWADTVGEEESVIWFS